MRAARLRGGSKLKGRRPAVFGTDPRLVGRPEPGPPATSGRLYAFAVARGGSPQVFCYDTDDEGMAALANLIRGERVVKVVRGEAVSFKQSSVVELTLSEGSHEHRLPLSGD